MKPTTIVKCLFGALSLSIGLQSLISCGQESDTRTAGEKGRELYVSYCQICHGEGVNEGPMADLLKVHPPNLMQISQRRGGQFPEEEIARIIDGRERLDGHGTLDMPIWGETFPTSEGLQRPREVRDAVENLVAYLKIIQQ
jgi:mono/diheme cytochrome c family protein